MADDSLRSAYFAGGCFWCMEAEFEGKDGIKEVISGYMGGKSANATYEQVSTGETGHFEAVEVRYDPEKITYAQLLPIFWSNVDPTDEGGQFADRGSQYHTAIFYKNPEEKALAEASKAKIAKELAPKPIATQILAAMQFFPAENYHQNYYKTHSVRYNMYKYGSGRVDTLKKIWGNRKPEDGQH